MYAFFFWGLQRLGSHTVSCQQYNGSNATNEGTSSVRQVKNFELKDGAGGGGGATYIFTVSCLRFKYNETMLFIIDRSCGMFSELKVLVWVYKLCIRRTTCWISERLYFS